MVTPQLLEYIKKQFSLGVSKDVIGASLKTSNWSNEDIQAAFNQLNLVENPNSSDTVLSNDIKLKKRRSPWIFVVISLVIVSVIGIVAVVKINQTTHYGLVNKKAIFNKGEFTYTSNVSNFSIQYPQSWPLTRVPADCDICVERFVFAPPFDVFKQDSDKGYIPSSAYGYINILKLNVYKTFDQRDESLKKDKQVANIEYLTIGGEKAIKYRTTLAANAFIISNYWVLHNGIEYNFNFYKNSLYESNPSEYVGIFEKILASIQFTR